MDWYFIKKIVLEKEIRLKEFNFKMLHGMLSCKKNLKQWRIKTDDDCDVCKEQQTIKHLLWDCPYVKPLWEIVGDVCGFEISFDRILGTEDCNGYDYVLTLISFLIYKEWLLLSLEGTK